MSNSAWESRSVLLKKYSLISGIAAPPLLYCRYRHNTKKLERKFITLGNDSGKPVLIAWDFEERLYKKIHFLSQDVLKKHNLKPIEMKSPWPHISAVYIKRALTTEERHKVKLAAGVIKPKFAFKQFDVLTGKEFDYLVLEFNVPAEYKRFEEFVEDLCGDVLPSLKGGASLNLVS